jgi:hypothetical protein
MKETFVLPEFLMADLASDGAARALMKRGSGVNFSEENTCL